MGSIKTLERLAPTAFSLGRRPDVLFLFIANKSTVTQMNGEVKGIFLQVIQLAVFLHQVVGVIAGVELAAAFFQQLTGFVQLAVLMNILLQPAGDGAHFAAGDEFVNAGAQLLLHDAGHLSGIGTTQGKEDGVLLL